MAKMLKAVHVQESKKAMVEELRSMKLKEGKGWY